MTIGMRELEDANGKLSGALDDILDRVDGTSWLNGAVESSHHRVEVSADACSGRRLRTLGIPLRPYNSDCNSCITKT